VHYLRKIYIRRVWQRINKLSVLNFFINSFFKIQDSNADIPVAAAVVENADTAEQVAPMHWKLPKRKGEADDINSNFSSLSKCNLFKLNWPFPIDGAHFPSTITSASLKSMILTHGPFEEDGRGPPIFNNTHYFNFSTEVTREWLCFSPNLRTPYCHTCWTYRSEQSGWMQKRSWVVG